MKCHTSVSARHRDITLRYIRVAKQTQCHVRAGDTTSFRQELFQSRGKQREAPQNKQVTNVGSQILFHSVVCFSLVSAFNCSSVLVCMFVNVTNKMVTYLKCPVGLFYLFIYSLLNENPLIL